MSNHDGNRQRTVTKRTTAFAGIRSIERIADAGASQMKNFRILSDGSLEKRCGYGTVIRSSGRIRGYWEGSISGVGYRFFVAGTALYRLSQNDSAPVQLTTLTASEDRVTFFRFRDLLCLADGYTLLYFRPATGLFTVAQGYVPLYGKNWHPTQLGEVNEPRNLLCNSLRVHYVNFTATQVFQLPFTAARIQSVLVGGEPVSGYTFRAPSSTVTIPASYATGGDVVISFDLDSIFSDRTSVLGAGHASVYRDGYHETLLTFGGKSPYRVFRTAAVSDEMLAGSRLCYPSSDVLYFRAEDAFALGSAEHPVTAAVQHLDRMLVFCDTGLWVLRHPSALRDDMEVVLWQGGIGCVATDGAVLCRGVPIVLSPSGIGRIGLFNSDSDICTLTLISDDLSDLLTEAVLRKSLLYWSGKENRIWLRCMDNSDGTVWIADPDGKCWIRYTGVNAVLLTDCQGSPGFGTADGRIAKFDETLNTDDGSPFEAVYLSTYLDFPASAGSRRTGRLQVTANTGGSLLRVEAETERELHPFRFSGCGQEPPEFFCGRFGTGRFRFLRYRIIAPGLARTRIYALSVGATI